MTPKPAWALTAALLLSAGLAGAHDALDAGELEVLLLADEGDDSFYVTGGFDIYEVYLGEAHEPTVGSGVAGDGFYFRGVLYGDHAERPPGAEAFRVVFSFTTPTGAVERFVSTTDGTNFDTDFDALDVAVGDGETVIKRAFVAGASVGAERGATVNGFAVESFVDGELRDRAPGGIFAPGSGGAVEVPFPSRVATESVTLAGPGGFVTAAWAPVADGATTLTVKSALKAAGQHVHLDVPEQPGWTVAVAGETARNLAASGETVFDVTIEAAKDAEPLRVELHTDVGGRTAWDAVKVGATPVLVAEGDPIPAAPSGIDAVPGLGAVFVVGLAAATAAAARDRRK